MDPLGREVDGLTNNTSLAGADEVDQASNMHILCVFGCRQLLGELGHVVFFAEEKFFVGLFQCASAILGEPTAL